MKYEIRYRPAYALLAVTLSPGESIAAESGSMTYMQPTLGVRTQKREKSLLGSLGLAVIGGRASLSTSFLQRRKPERLVFPRHRLGTSRPSMSAPGRASSSRSLPTSLRRGPSTST